MNDTISNYTNLINRRLTRLNRVKQEAIKNRLQEIELDKSLNDEETESELMKIIKKIKRLQ